MAGAGASQLSAVRVSQPVAVSWGLVVGPGRASSSWSELLYQVVDFFLVCLFVFLLFKGWQNPIQNSSQHNQIA